MARIPQRGRPKPTAHRRPRRLDHGRLPAPADSQCALRLRLGPRAREGGSQPPTSSPRPDSPSAAPRSSWTPSSTTSSRLSQRRGVELRGFGNLPSASAVLAPAATETGIPLRCLPSASPISARPAPQRTSERGLVASTRTAFAHVPVRLRGPVQSFLLALVELPSYRHSNGIKAGALRARSAALTRRGPRRLFLPTTRGMKPPIGTAYWRIGRTTMITNLPRSACRAGCPPGKRTARPCATELVRLRPTARSTPPRPGRP